MRIWLTVHSCSSAVKLAYSDAQAVIDGGSIPDAKIGEGQHRDDVEADILTLAVRPLRCLAKDLTDPLFVAEHCSSTSCSPLRERRAHDRQRQGHLWPRRRGLPGRLRNVHSQGGERAHRGGQPLCLCWSGRVVDSVAQFMLLANISVAGKIAAGLPDQALLRRHEPPIDRRLVSPSRRASVA